MPCEFVFLRSKRTLVNQLHHIIQPIESDLNRFNRLFDETLTHPNKLLNVIFEHIRQHRGKQMRPILLLLVAREFGVPTDATYLSAVMLELLHNASLIHDDIVDESDERRGQAAVHSEYGNNVAVLVGDFLLSSSLEKAAQTGNLRIVEHISHLGKQLASGEIIQLSNTYEDEFSEDSYYDVIKLKTAALFSSAAEVGALSVAASEEQVALMTRFGSLLGMCFQIKDDIFDYFDNPQIGKPTGNDMSEGKLTLPVLYVLRTKANDRIKNLARRVRAGLATKEEIAELVQFTIDNGGVDYAQEVMQKYADAAVAILDRFKNEEIKQSLLSYIKFVSERTI